MLEQMFNFPLNGPAADYNQNQIPLFKSHLHVTQSEVSTGNMCLLHFPQLRVQFSAPGKPQKTRTTDQGSETGSQMQTLNRGLRLLLL